jgi:dienelactone hydrolase
MPADELPGLPPLGVIKLPVRFALREGARVPAGPASYELEVRFGGHPDEPARSETLHLVAREPGAPRRVTRRSPIDDSVQEYAVRQPAASTPDTRSPPALVLSLHGAGADCLNQAASYSSRPGWWIVAPSNRRPYGFDWQDWGRLDAYETLEHALSWTGADGTRVALTGHSMGGHGTWHLAVNDPDRFIAVAPSAGWSTFDQYPGRPAGALAALWHAADGAGETFELLPNLVDTPVYVLHGDADDNVPASEGRELFDALAAAVGAARERGLPVVEPQFHLQPGAGHWWDGDAAPGVDCVDWPGFFVLFDSAQRRVPTSPTTPYAPGVSAATRFEWTCVDPAIDSTHEWISVIRPAEYGRPVHISAQWDPSSRRVEVTTENAQLLVLRWPDGQPPRICTVDGDSIAWAVPGKIGSLIERSGVWLGGADLEQAAANNWDWGHTLKSPARSGPFKRAFDNHFVLVYGTAGDEVEDAELLARARYDSEVWRYRGNGCAAVWSDREALAPQNLRRMAGRNLILYGNRDTNLAVQACVPPECPLVAARGRIALGDRVWEGDDLAAFCVYPRVGDGRALLGWFADSGPKGCRLGYSLAPFVSGVGCPDFAIFDMSVLAQGDAGVKAAGWFDSHWRAP